MAEIPQRVFVVQCASSVDPGGAAVVAVRGSLAAAQEFVARREGVVLAPQEWEHHNSHGPLWQVVIRFRINRGPQLTNTWSITEHNFEP